MHSCGKCGSVNSTDSIFCGTCGNRLNNKCPFCAFENLPQQKFCGQCGKQLQQDNELPASAVQYGAKATSPGIVEGAGQLAPSAQSVAAPNAQAAQPTAPTTTSNAPHTGAETSYALASIEVANWDQLRATAMDVEQLEKDRQQVLIQVAKQVLEANGQVHGSKNGVLFVCFPRESALRA